MACGENVPSTITQSSGVCYFSRSRRLQPTRCRSLACGRYRVGRCARRGVRRPRSRPSPGSPPTGAGSGPLPVRGRLRWPTRGWSWCTDQPGRAVGGRWPRPGTARRRADARWREARTTTPRPVPVERSGRPCPGPEGLKVSPLVGFGERMLVVHPVGSIHSGCPMAGHQGGQGRVEQGRVAGPLPKLPCRSEQLSVNRRAHPLSIHPIFVA